ncbi:MAG: voltage-gated potassium channel [Arenicella sp.]|jgi:voltage-gated potassium channel
MSKTAAFGSGYYKNLIRVTGKQMVSFLLNLARFFRGLHKAWAQPDFRSTLLLTTIILISGTVFYSNVEGWNLLDSAYFCVMTLTTIGYGDLHPTSDFSKLFTMFYSIIGIGIFVTLITQIARAQINNKD